MAPTPARALPDAMPEAALPVALAPAPAPSSKPAEKSPLKRGEKRCPTCGSHEPCAVRTCRECGHVFRRASSPSRRRVSFQADPLPAEPPRTRAACRRSASSVSSGSDGGGPTLGVGAVGIEKPPTRAAPKTRKDAWAFRATRAIEFGCPAAEGPETLGPVEGVVMPDGSGGPPEVVATSDQAIAPLVEHSRTTLVHPFLERAEYIPVALVVPVTNTNPLDIFGYEGLLEGRPGC